MAHTVHTTSTEAIRVASVEELKQQGCIVVTEGPGPIAVFYHDGNVHAVDNRCPHMGFPLHRGTVQDGILTCHWHHAQFDLVSGCTFNLFADDVPTYPVEVRDGGVYLTPLRDRSGEVAYWKQRLQEGLEQSITLVIAKAIIALLKAGIPYQEIVDIGAKYGVRYRAAGWGSGLTILTAMANLLPYLHGEERILPLYQGLLHVAFDCDGQPPRFDLQPLSTTQIPMATLKRWFRHFVEVRDQEGATRCLLTAVNGGASPAQLIDLMLAAATDHFFLDGGHALDFINKASEMLDHIGWEHATTVLPSLIRQVCTARRSEELNSWRHPIDLVPLLRKTFEELPSLLAASNGAPWPGPAALAEVIVGDDPHATVDALKQSLRNGATPLQLSQALAYAAALRIARFHTQNEFGDWITVLHTFTYCNALHQALKRTGSPDLVRGIFHGAMRVYLDRFLNIPPARLPGERGEVDGPSGADDLLDGFLEALDTQQQVDEASGIVHRYVSLGHPVDRLFRTFAQALLREDAEFHSFQMLEAGLRQYEELKGTAESEHVLIAAARYLAAHAPTQRTLNQTARIAMRLNRGEALYEEE
ncbi:MAG: Rieske (2Fe-2S) protein [Candidatus Latescibacteria bacterium]|nr:Rieske (2Fe-2S) protein [Candidatus Latescibacterota bacterium]